MGKLQGSLTPSPVPAGHTPSHSAVAASTANVDESSAPATLDGVTLVAGERVLLKDQTDAKENGVYIFNGSGSAMTRSTDMDEDSEILYGALVYVTEGTANADTQWKLTSDVASIGTDNLAFASHGVAAITGSGTLNTHPLWTPDGSTLGNSAITQTGTQTVFPIGTDAAPSICFAGDTNTGFTQVTADPDSITVSIGGVQHAYISAGLTLWNGTSNQFQGTIVANGNIQLGTGDQMTWGTGVQIDGDTLPSGTPTVQFPNMAGRIAIQTDKQTAALTADDTAITVTASQILLTSDNATSTNRTFTLATTGAQEGQKLTIRFSDGTNACEIIATANNLLIGGSTITFNAVGQRVEFEFNEGKWEQATALVAVA